MEQNPTLVDDVELPVVVVELKHLKDRLRQPVRVLCERVDELTLLEVLGLPGERAPEVAEGDAAAATADPLENARALERVAPRLIEAGTALDCRDPESGAVTRVRPAFYFDEARPHHPRSLPGRYLRAADKEALVRGVMLAGNYLGGDAEAGSFPGGERGGDGDGVGAAPAGPVGGPDRVGIGA